MRAAREQHKLAAILAANVVGYSRFMERDGSRTLARLQVVSTKPWPVAYC
jgi:class 3 adenylate cyclase